MSLQDPARGMDASHAHTFVYVLGQPQFPSVVTKSLNKFIDDSADVNAGRCASGFHRVDTFGRVMMSAGKCVLGSDEKHMITVLHVPLIECTQHKSINGASNGDLFVRKGAVAGQELVRCGASRPIRVRIRSKSS